MNQFGIKLAAMLGLGMTLALASCGGGGGDPGTPLIPPTAKLIMTPNLAGVTMGLGQTREPVKISGGQPPYYAGATGGVTPTMLDDGSVFLQAYAVNNTATASTDGSSPTACTSTDKVWVQDSSYNPQRIEFGICVMDAPSVPLQSLYGDLTLNLGSSQPFPVYGGAAPYTAVSDRPTVATVSGNGATGNFTITTSNTVGNAYITVTDAKGESFFVIVDNVAASAFEASPAILSGRVGDIRTVSLLGVGATNKPLRVTSSDTNVAVPVLNGSLIAVNLVGGGTATLTVLDRTGAIIAVDVTVTAPPSSGTTPPPTTSPD